jgi:hypothetical protein
MRHHFCSHILEYIALLAELFSSDKEKKAAFSVCVCVCVCFVCVLCVCHSVFLSRLIFGLITGSKATCFAHYASGGHQESIIFYFLNLIITIWKAYEFELQEAHCRILALWTISVEYRMRK